MNPVITTARPWWQSAFMNDGFDAGGVGVTGEVYRHLGPPETQSMIAGLPLQSDTSKKVFANAAILGGSIIGGLLGYGLFGHLRDKGWGPWKAGATVGLLGGVGALIMMHGVGAITGKQFLGRLPRRNRYHG